VIVEHGWPPLLAGVQPGYRVCVACPPDKLCSPNRSRSGVPVAPAPGVLQGCQVGRVLEDCTAAADLTLFPVDERMLRICMELTGREASATGGWEGPGPPGPWPRLPGRLLKESPGILLPQRPRKLRSRPRKLRPGQGSYARGQGSYAPLF
jgi:hypothetical protein